MTTNDQWSKADKHEALTALYKAGMTSSQAHECLPAVMMLADAAMIPPWQAADLVAVARVAFTPPPDRLPFWCRVRRHGWRPRPYWGGWTRRTCRRCYGLDITRPRAATDD